MTESPVPPPDGWRYGLHPDATAMRIRSLSRIDVPLGEALRLEMGSADAGGEDIVHLQYYIVTDLGAWALWLSCAAADLADREAALRDISPPFGEA